MQVAEECSSKILAIEYEYAKKKRPLLQARGQALRQIPQFWKKVSGNECIAVTSRSAFGLQSAFNGSFVGRGVGEGAGRTVLASS
jgi:hypothetical protein